MLASVVIRTFNEAKRLPDLLGGLKDQKTDGLDVETIVVDSGSTDATVAIARDAGARVLTIDKERFTFGRSLNLGFEAARGDFLVAVSGHCHPVDGHWLQELTRPLADQRAVYAYGRQIGHGVSHFSELQVLKKYFPERSAIPQDGFFVNNANAALLRNVWSQYRFNEELSGLEDMELGKRLVNDGHKIAYVAEACVYHVHEETWHKVQVRYEREALALRAIMPEVHVSFADFLRYYASSVLHDCGAALQERRLLRTGSSILTFRLMQFWGSYRGNHEHRRLSRNMKERYFYPR